MSAYKHIKKIIHHFN